MHAFTAWTVCNFRLGNTWPILASSRDAFHSLSNIFYVSSVKQTSRNTISVWKMVWNPFVVIGWLCNIFRHHEVCLWKRNALSYWRYSTTQWVITRVFAIWSFRTDRIWVSERLLSSVTYLISQMTYSDFWLFYSWRSLRSWVPSSRELVWLFVPPIG